MARIIMYGDSNTYGCDPTNLFGEAYSNPWPSVYQQLTGRDIANCGQPGREIPFSPKRLEFIMHQLEREEPFDAIFVMLGTNDLLNMPVPDVNKICDKMEAMLRKFMEKYVVVLLGVPKIEINVPSRDKASRELNVAYRQLALKLGIAFIDISDWDLPLAYDGVHLSEEAHQNFGKKLSETL